MKNHHSLYRYFICLFCFLFIVPGCSENKKETGPLRAHQVKTIVLEETTLAHHRSFPGKVQPSQQVDLSFRVPGPLIEFPVIEGQDVSKSELLARIDPRDYETTVDHIKSSLAGAKAQLKAMRNGARPEDLRVLEAAVEAAKANYRSAELDYQRVAALYQEQATTKATLDQSRAARDVAKANYQTAVQNLEKGRKGSRQEDIDAQTSTIVGLVAKLEQAQDNLEDTNLRAPFKGVVAKKYVQNYQDIQAKQPILNLQDLENIEIVVQVPEQLIVRTDNPDLMEITAVFDALPNREFPMTFKEIATQADAQTNTYPVTVSMSAPEGVHLLLGMTAQVTVGWTDPGTEKTPVFKVPVEAVWADKSDQPYVWVVSEDLTVHRKKVKLGELTGNSILIMDGVAPGERLVVAGINFLGEGQKVRLMNSGSEKL